MKAPSEKHEGQPEGRLKKEALQVTKEIVVKFIETQRVSPTNFEEVFPAVFRVVCRAIADESLRDTASRKE